jgi:hypothetical protein
MLHEELPPALRRRRTSATGHADYKRQHNQQAFMEIDRRFI